MISDRAGHERLSGPVIESTRNQRVRDAAALGRRSARSRSRRFLVEGPQAVRELLLRSDAGDAVSELFFTHDAAERHADLLDLAEESGLQAREIDPKVLDSLVDTVANQGVLAISRFIEQPSLEQLVAGLDGGFLAILGQVRDPGNAGTVIRAADAAGASGVILTRGSVDLHNPKTVRSAVGSHFHLPLIDGVELADTVRLLHAAGVAVYAADAAEPALDLHGPEAEAALAAPHAWLFGNEAWGLPAEDLELADTAIRVPLHGRAESLNLGTAAAVCLYESARLRRG